MGILAGRFAILLCCLALTGCGVIATSSTTAPKASAKSTTTTTQLDDKGKPKSTTTTVREATSTGTGTSATGDKVNQKSEAQPAAVSFDGITATGGGGKSNTSATGTALKAAMQSPLLWVGIACWLLAAVAFWQGWKSIVLPAVGAGAVFLAVAFYPALLLWAMLALVVIVGGPYVWTAIQGTRAKEALRAVVAGVEAAPPEAAEAVKAEVAKQADDADKTTIMAVKRKDNL